MINIYPTIAMPAHKYITDEAFALLTEIGFPAEPLMRGEHQVPHSRHRALIVSFDGCAVLDPETFTFRLFSSVSGAYSDLRIPSRIVAQRKPFWKKTVMRWYTKAVFSLAEARRREEQRETEKRQERERVLAAMAQHIPADVNVMPERVYDMLPMHFDSHDELSPSSYMMNSIRLDLHGLPNEQSIPMVARVLAFLEKEKIPFHS